MKLEVNKTLQGHVLDMLKLIPDESIDCIITSPPYYQLRNYINIEIHPDNVELNQDRIERKLGMFA